MGLAPYSFETDAMLYVSDKGDISGRVEAEYEWLLTQRVVLQARLETLLAWQQVPKFGIEKGIKFFETGQRVRYEIKRKIAPYLGINFKQLIGDAADKQVLLNQDKNEFSVLTGIQFWF